MNNGKKTKVVCTIGPATQSEEKLTELLKSGMNVMRLNFSHGDFSEHQGKVDNLRKVMKKTGMKAAIMQDLSGPKFRIGDFYQERVQLKAGEFITLTTEKIVGDEKRVSVNYPTLHEEIEVGNTIMVDDGKKKFEVVEINGHEIKCKIIIGGETKGRRGLNLPGAKLKISALTDKDKKDIEFGIKNKVDLVAFSFVRNANDVRELRAILDKAKSKAKIIAKLESPDSITNFDEILELVDIVMVARGDLGIELGHEKITPVQRMMIERCNMVGKPVITATQMLESMIKSPFPTRAEVSDIAHAIYDGTDAVMLSEESALGEHPIAAVSMMTAVAKEVEKDERFFRDRNCVVNSKNIELNALSYSAVEMAEGIDAKAIVVLSETGDAVRTISALKPAMYIMCATTNATVGAQILVSFGAYELPISSNKDNSVFMKEIKTSLVKEKIATKKDSIVVVDEKNLTLSVESI